jgi:hypothetical protein
MDADKTTRVYGYQGVAHSVGDRNIGMWAHYLGDSYSHTQPNGQTYLVGPGHIFEGDGNWGLDIWKHH